ncbi:MAG: hypothetical protein IJT79_06920 [Ruminococcus sp.]|nr:hypothetical protein [Ruminococcus sp.]
MNNKTKSRAFMIINCLALMIIAANLTSPVHEATHMLTQVAAGMKPEFLGFGINSTAGTVSVDMNSFFWKLMYEGSAALMNVAVGFILLLILSKIRFGPLSRAFMLMLTIMHLSMGFGYFLRDGIAYSPNNGMGDWCKVLDRFDGSIALRIGMLVVGSAGILLTFYIAYRQAYHFIKNNNDKKERNTVASALYLFPFILFSVVYTLLGLVSPLAAEIGAVNSLIFGAITNVFGMITFFWGYMFTAIMVKPMKKSIYYFSPCADKKIILWIGAAALLLFDVFVLCPGIYF